MERKCFVSLGIAGKEIKLMHLEMFTTVKTQVNFIGGLGLKIARGLLRYEIEDAGEGGSRQMKDSIIAKYYYSIHPVPAKNYLVLVTNNTVLLTYKIYDMVGSIVKTGERNAEPINIYSLAPGAYTLIACPENDKQICLKFIKLK